MVVIYKWPQQKRFKKAKISEIIYRYSDLLYIQNNENMKEIKITSRITPPGTIHEH